MKYVKTETEEYMDTEDNDLYDQPIIVRNVKGYKGCDIEIEAAVLTWDQLDLLKAAISIAENRWRKYEKRM